MSKLTLISHAAGFSACVSINHTFLHNLVTKRGIKMDLLKIALTSIASVVALFLLTKLMGNKQLSQLSMFDYIIGISIGSIAAEFATELENPERTLLAMVIYAVSAYLVSLMTNKSTRLR